uniref:Uncharacterized protein n=1 Tax=Anguilla anguilla TaxID=7936 RepID=A0A0E9V5X5_ANGAN
MHNCTSMCIYFAALFLGVRAVLDDLHTLAISYAVSSQKRKWLWNALQCKIE